MSGHVESATLTAARDTTAVAVQGASFWVACGLASGTVVALSLARFAYSLLLPAMQADLHWSYAQAGSMNTAIAAGYLAGALVAGHVAEWLGIRRSFMLGLLLTAAVLIATAFCDTYVSLLVARFVAGVVTAVVFVVGFSLAARAGAGRPGRGTRYASIYMSGAGAGIVLSGLLIPPLLSAGMGWRAGWVVLGGLSLIAALAAWPALRLSPVPATTGSGARGGTLSGLKSIAFAYFAYGAGYFSLITFIIAYLRDAGYPRSFIVDFWVLVGVAVTVSMFAWGPLLARVRGGWGVAMTTSILIASALILLTFKGEAAACVSALLLGGSFVASATAQLDFARQITPPHLWTRLIAALTVGFSAGQCLGPVLSGFVSDRAGGLSAGIAVAVGLLLVCIVSALLQQPPQCDTEI